MPTPACRGHVTGFVESVAWQACSGTRLDDRHDGCRLRRPTSAAGSAPCSACGSSSRDHGKLPPAGHVLQKSPTCKVPRHVPHLRVLAEPFQDGHPRGVTETAGDQYAVQIIVARTMARTSCYVESASSSCGLGGVGISGSAGPGYWHSLEIRAAVVSMVMGSIPTAHVIVRTPGGLHTFGAETVVPFFSLDGSVLSPLWHEYGTWPDSSCAARILSYLG